jgi:hypothetical protein
LCLLDIRDPWPPGDRSRPRRAGRIDVYLVDTSAGTCGSQAHDHPEHRPALTYYAADNLGIRKGTPLLPSPLGTEIAVESLQRKRVDIIPPYDYRKRVHTFGWGRAKSLPSSPEQDRWLRWVLGGEELWGKRRSINHSGVATRVDFHCGGFWQAQTVFRNREVDGVRPVRWLIDGRVRALARDVVCRLFGFRHGPTIRLSGLRSDGSVERNQETRDIVLTPGADDLLRFSITNLSQEYRGRSRPHLGAFAAMLQGVDEKNIKLPQQVDMVACQGHECEAAKQP